MFLLKLCLMVYLFSMGYSSSNLQKQTIMVVLGCAIDYIQEDRVDYALKYVNEKIDNSHIIWYLTGGVKKAISEKTDKSEASKMLTKISYNNILLDELATNTAENFLYLRERIKSFPDTVSLEIIITTSEFHKERAEKIFNGIFETMPYQAKWNLSGKACPTCWMDEKIHMKNVRSDVEKALNKKLLLL